jgi:uncharacterized protein YecE (DUF72 family)
VVNPFYDKLNTELKSERMTDAQTNSPPRVQVGCQGWNYDDWVTPPAAARPVFYPRGTRAEHMLDAYARAFDTVEVDSTFYAAPQDSTYDTWARRVPGGFSFALKLPQKITHEESLRGRSAADALEEFCRGARRLGEKLAAVLVQLPPQFEATRDNLRALSDFLPLLPAAATLLDTSDHAYVRWMGARDLTRFDEVVRPRDLNLDKWAAALERLRERVPYVCAYFSNFYEGHAPASANKLKRLLGDPIVTPDELEDQPSLF